MDNDLVNEMLKIGIDAARDMQHAAADARTINRIIEILRIWVDANGEIWTEGARGDYLDLVQQIWEEVKKSQ